jgi:hypothetical protein
MSRAAAHKEIAALHHENLLIFVNRERTQSLWYWVKREDGKSYPRDHYFEINQPGDLFLAKLSALVFEIGELDPTDDVSVIEVAKRLRDALDIERVTRRFYEEFRAQHLAFIELIGGIPNERDRKWYASVLLNRLMFIYFLQKKGFIDNGDMEYLQNKLAATRRRGADLFYHGFLKLLFFEGFAKTDSQRSPEARRLLGSVKYLKVGSSSSTGSKPNIPTSSSPTRRLRIFSLCSGVTHGTSTTRPARMTMRSIPTFSVTSSKNTSTRKLSGPITRRPR